MSDGGQACRKKNAETAEICVQYFREHPVFDRLLKGFREKYLSYGSFSGTVVLRNLTESEREDLEGFLQKNYHGKKSVSIQAALFKKALADSRFGELRPEEVLNLYFGEKLTGKRAREQAQRQEREDVYARMQKQYAGTPAEAWIQAVKGVPDKIEKADAGNQSDDKKDGNADVRSQSDDKKAESPALLYDASQNCVQMDKEKKPCAEAITNEQGLTAPVDTQEQTVRVRSDKVPGTMRSWLMNRYRENGYDPETLARDLDLGAAIVNEFPYRKGNQEYLAVFAARLTGNPHAFDDGTRGGQLLTLAVLWEMEKKKMSTPGVDLFPAMRRQRQYLAVGILRDDMSNYAMLSGIRARKKDGVLHAGIEGFRMEGEPVQVPLSVIADWEQIEGPENTMYIVENPSIYALLCQRWRGRHACMCMNGQPRLSAILVLDLLARAGTTVYYAGDFDPEGLLIAQKIKKYYLRCRNLYEQAFHFWHMTQEDCLASLSGEPITPKRMKMLARITDPELQKAASLLREHGVAGYQENIWERYH